MSSLIDSFGVPAIIGGIVCIILFSIDVGGDKNIFGGRPLPWIGVLLFVGGLAGMIFLLF